MDEARPDVASSVSPEKLLEKLLVLEQLFVKRIRDDAAHAVAFDALHRELTTYRDDALRGWQKPLLKGMLLLHDAMMRSLESLPEGPGREAVELHLEELIELLHRHDVERMKDPEGRFDPKVQMAVGTEPAAAPEEDQTIVRVVRDGFLWGGHVLRPQEIVLRVYRNP